jgi:tetratricopeptide (TPR) repeat protein
MRTLAIASALLLSALSAQANLELTLRAERTSHPPKGAPTVKHADAPPKQTLHVTLGARWFRWDDGSSSATYDLAKRRVFLVDAGKHELDDQSLFATVSGRETELQSRSPVAGAPGQPKAAGNPVPLTIAEHQLSLRRDAKTPSEIASSTAAGERRYSYRNGELMAWSTELVAVKPAERDQFVRFFRYRFGGHPEILAALGSLAGIPKRLRITDPTRGETTQIEISDMRETVDAPAPPVPSGFKAKVSDPVIGAATALVKSSTAESRNSAIARVLAAAGAAADAHKPLDAMLGYFEATLINGGQLPQEFSPHKDAIVADSNVRAMMAALRAGNDEQAKAALATLAGIQRAAPGKAYVVGIFKADMEQRLGDTTSAIADFHAALARNPFLTGVWKDLGDVLRQTHRPEEAWHCYDTARLIMHGQPLLAEVGDTEARLVREHVEYF